MTEDVVDQDIQEARDKFLNVEFDEKVFEIDPNVTTEYARYCGETAPRFLDQSDPDFQAPPTFVALSSRTLSLPSSSIPWHGICRAMDGSERR